MSAIKPLVLVVGATGQTGRSIVDGLLESGNFRVAALVRPSSLSKPVTEKLREAGVEIRAGDITDDFDKLKTTLAGVDVLISAVVAWLITEQKHIIRAAKEVGVGRVIPCDFAVPGAKGVRWLHDLKLEVREYMQEIGVPYTFIDVGWWMQLMLPIALRTDLPQSFKDTTWKMLRDKDPLMLLTNLDHIGKFVARIVADPRTLNHAVIIWEDQRTVREAHEIGERVSGEGEELKSRRIYAEPNEILDVVAAAQEQLKTDPKNTGLLTTVSWNQYLQSMYVLEENTLENAKRLGYLDARELYPDIVPCSLEEYAKEYYTKGTTAYDIHLN